MSTITYKNFHASTVPLQGSNLIEASAGTGKTYSIAILVLRLVIEKQMPLQQILMVTFTKAAVAELEERIRLFIRSAYKASCGAAIADSNIQHLVQQAALQHGAAQTMQHLREAVLFLDETSVLTIHSFCQQTLTEFAFETNQLFGAEMKPDISDIIAESVHQCWRKYITTLPAGLLKCLLDAGINRGSMQQIVKEHLGGKKYWSFDCNKTYSLDAHDCNQLQQEAEALQQQEDELRNCLMAHYEQHKEDIRKRCESNGYAKKALLELVDEPEAFIKAMLEKQGTGYVQKLFKDLLELHAPCRQLAEARLQLMQQLITDIHCLAISLSEAFVSSYMQRSNQLTYDDLIRNLHAALVGRDNPRLEAGLRKKYQAVFIDEFQDTDRMQYEVFQKAFGTESLLFYIGDPKQSIYAWRKADVFTYFEARSKVDHVYSMNHNYRSSAPMIAAMNAFFLPTPGFDTFHFNSMQEAISYMPVESPEPNGKGILLEAGLAAPPICIANCENKSQIQDAIVAQVYDLLANEAKQIEKGGQKRRIQPADIGILVRSNAEAREIKTALGRAGIAAITIDDARVLQSEEARYLLYLLQAMHQPGRATINRALLSPFTGMERQSILRLDDEAVLNRFRQYRERWEHAGVYAAIMDFIHDFNVRPGLLDEQHENGLRIITNLYQLAELVHQCQSRKQLSEAELIGWLQRGIDGMSTEGDEYEQRMESDEASVRIVTIHKSKGLEYHIVLAPYLDFKSERPKDTFGSFRHPEQGEYFTREQKLMDDDHKGWMLMQAEQENRRLLYVAITRAVYQCYIFKNTSKQIGKTTLSCFSNALEPSELIRIHSPLSLPQGFKRLQPPQPARAAVAAPRQRVQFKLLEPHWRRMSYTFLSENGALVRKARAREQQDSYDQFTFQQLDRGAKTGNMLHYLFEHLPFRDENRWQHVIEETVRRFVPGQQERYQPMLLQMLQHVLGASIPTEAGVCFTLSQLGRNQFIPEFEFDMPVPLFDTKALLQLATPERPISIKQFDSLEGMMNGKIDLFFEQDGRYYILDWKSNYLGDTLEDYEQQALQQAMDAHNYHLQYLIYCLAAKQYLETRLPAFDYERDFGGVVYVFVRGVRQQAGTGLYITKPDAATIQRMEALLCHNKQMLAVSGA